MLVSGLHTHTHTSVHAHTCTYSRSRIRTNTHTHTHTHTYTHTHAHIHTHTHTHTHTCIHTYTLTHVCVYVVWGGGNCVNHKPKWLTFTETFHIRKLAQQLHRGGFLHSQVAGVVGSPHAEGTARRRVQTSQSALQGRPRS